MYLRVKGEPFTEHVFREIRAATDRASCRVDSVKYDEQAGTLSFRVRRYPPRTRRGLFSSLLPFVQDTSRQLATGVVVRSVTRCIVRNNIAEEGADEVTLRLGLTVEGRNVCIASAEETSGVVWFTVEAEVSEVDIEIADLDRGGPPTLLTPGVGDGAE